MGSTVKVPAPSQEERDLQRNQAELLSLQREIIEQQRRQNAVLTPFIAEQEGFDVTVDAQGNITSISKRPDPNDPLRKELETGLLQRSVAALKGELPVDPGLEEGLTQQERELRDRLSAQLGPGYETSSPGIATLGEFFRTSEILREGARTGQLTLAEQLGITREQQDIFRRQSSTDALRQTSIGDPLTFAGGFGQTARGYGAAQQPFIQQRQMQLSAAQSNAQNSMSMLGAGMGLASAFMFSDVRMKADVTPIGSELLPGVPHVTYRFIWDEPDVRRLGVLAQDMAKVMPEAVYEDEEGVLMIDQAVYDRLVDLRRFDLMAAGVELSN